MKEGPIIFTRIEIGRILGCYEKQRDTTCPSDRETCDKLRWIYESGAERVEVLQSIDKG